MVDLADCAREPVHVPGTIQDFGVLLVLTEPGLEVAQISDNVHDHFAIAVEDVLGRPLAKLLESSSVDLVRDALVGERWLDVNPLAIRGWREHRFDGIVHRHEGAAILELEPHPETPHPTIHPFRSALLRVQRARTRLELADIVVDEMQRVTGFERVMLYRFHEDGSGSVDAEARVPGLESYLGLRYPASDIPAQVRRLYLDNPLRMIVDARREPARIVPTLRPDTGRSLDLRFAVLRGVSPIHREYMRNMGACASMSVALVVRDRLWGLISCLHHTGPRRVSHELRSASEFLARLTSLQIDAFDDRETIARRASRRATETALYEVMRETATDEPLAALFTRPRELLGLVGAGGCALVGAREPITCGEVPPPALLEELAAWLDARGDLQSFSTATLGELLPAALAASGVASGVLTFALPGPRRLLWFRPEIVRTVHWGGDPTKPVDAETGRLRPRNSFKLWRQEVHAHAARWTDADLEAADDLHRRAVEVDLEHRLRSEQQAVRVRDDVTAIVSHDLRSPLSVILSQVEILLMRARASGAEPEKLERILRAATTMQVMIEDLLDLSTIEAGRFSLNVQVVDSRDLLEEALAAARPLADARHIELATEWTELPRLDADPDRISQVLANLLGNAIKFTPEGGTVTVRAEPRPDELVIAVADTGPGIAADHLAHVFDRYWRAEPSSRRGAGLGLYIAHGIVAAHHGRIWAESSETGARLSFTLPRHA